jgi:hypothetical protein
MLNFTYAIFAGEDRQCGTSLLTSDIQLEPNSAFSEDKLVTFEFKIYILKTKYCPMILEKVKIKRL